MKYILAVNPWIYDFAAYDFWMKPLGLLYLVGMLKKSGLDVVLVDFLNRSHPCMPQKSKSSIYGKGHFLREAVETPAPLRQIPINRRFARYGVPPEELRRDLPQEPPTLILVTSTMTYWYVGVKESIEFLKDVYPEIPIVLGGIYPTLCFEHAKEHIKADYILKGFAPESLEELIYRHTGIRPELKKYKRFNNWPAPAIEDLSSPTYGVITTSLGCPYRCPYCASYILHPSFETKSPEKIVKEIQKMSTIGVKDIAFYDDALLYKKPHIKGILKGIIEAKMDVRFHTPNAMHARFIDEETAALMKAAGFVSIYLGLETSDFSRQKSLGGKVFSGEFTRAVKYLKKAGLTEISAYILVGLPGQTLDEVKATMEFCYENGVKPYLSEFSPIPKTPMWKLAVKTYNWHEPVDPLWHNNTLMPIFSPTFTPEVYYQLKRLQKKINQ